MLFFSPNLQGTLNKEDSCQQTWKAGQGMETLAEDDQELLAQVYCCLNYFELFSSRQGSVTIFH